MTVGYYCAKNTGLYFVQTFKILIRFYCSETEPSHRKFEKQCIQYQEIGNWLKTEVKVFAFGYILWFFSQWFRGHYFSNFGTVLDFCILYCCYSVVGLHLIKSCLGKIMKAAKQESWIWSQCSEGAEPLGALFTSALTPGLSDTPQVSASREPTC